MKTRFFVLISAALMIAACCGNSGNKTSCKADEKASCKAHAEKPCCKAAEEASCKVHAEKPCCKATEPKKIISAQVLIKPEKVDDFVAFSKDLIEKSRAEEGCISYSLYQDPQDKTKFLFFEEWKNQAAVDFHFATEHFKAFGEKIGDFASSAPVITIYDSIAEKIE